PGCDRHRLYRAGGALRELHTPGNHPLDIAVRRCRRAAGADGVQHAARSDLTDRHHSIDRHRQKERDHDGRLRPRRGAQPGDVAGECDPSGLPAALPPDHDDDDGGATRRPAARGRHRHRFGTAPAARHLDRRWLVAEPVSDAVHDARHLPGLLLATATVPAPHGPRSRPPHRRMNPFSAPILRPVATTLLSLGIILLGIVAYLHMPIAALPSVDRPTIGVWAGLPGASADTI